MNTEEEDLRKMRRASGDVLCETCSKEYRKHPLATELHNLSGIDGEPFLHRLCNGDLVKL
jgi:hypothetical protein